MKRITSLTEEQKQKISVYRKTEDFSLSEEMAEDWLVNRSN